MNDEVNDEVNDDEFDCVLEATSRFFAYAPFEQSPEIVPVELKLVTSEGTVIGQASADLVSTVRIDDDDLFEVCDADSAGLSWACDALFPRGSGELHPELNPDHDVVFRFMFIHRAAFLPLVTAEQRMIFMHLVADRFMDGEGVVIMGQTTVDLAPSQLAELGYRRIAGTDFVFCFAARTNSFSDAFDLDEGGIVVVLPETAGQDFAALWKKVCER